MFTNERDINVIFVIKMKRKTHHSRLPYYINLSKNSKDIYLFCLIKVKVQLQVNSRRFSYIFCKVTS